MRQKILALAVCICLLPLGISGCNLPLASTETPLPPTATSLPPTATDTPVPPTPVPPTLTPTPAMPVLINTPFNETSSSPVFTLTVNYPQIDPASLLQVEPFNQEVHDIVMDVVNSMRNDFITNATGLPPDAAANGSYLEINYNATYVSPSIISIKFFFHFYYAGAAHPNTFYLSYNYDVLNHRALDLADVFQSGSDYLTVVSNACVAELSIRLGADAWLSGAGPDLVNYKTWNITPAGLNMTFDPYQVAAYAAGPQEVLIPYPTLSGIYLPQFMP